MNFPPYGCHRFIGVLFIFLFTTSLLLPRMGVAQQEVTEMPEDLKRLSIEELMDIEVNLVSRTPQKLSEAASAVQVITGEAIRRSGATNIPEALRLVTNLQVAQYNANTWIISSRGFNTIFANKLLVMIDGRTVYTPFFGGVLWELQNVLLEDVERIEVVSGPGGTLWGANAVNGVINIVTKSSAQTQRTYAAASVGTFVRDRLAARYGGRIGKNLTYRVYGQHMDRNPTLMPDGSDSQDAWRITQGGFRADWTPTAADVLTFQGDLYGGIRKTAGGNSGLNGENVLGRWKHTLSNRSDLSLQLYYDRYFRSDVPSGGSDEMKTYDVDFQHRFAVKERHQVLWGAGYRLSSDDAHFQSDAIGIIPRFRKLPLYTAFLQDEIQVGERIRLIVGTKFLHNVYSGFEIQPSVRMAWTREGTTVWSAVSRAVRTPTRLDVDYFLPAYPVPADKPSVAGGPDFVSEKLVAYELGYRLQPTPYSSLSLAGFYNVYRDVYSVEALPNTLTYQIQNGSEGESWGVEFAGNYQVLPQWRLRSGYTYFMKDLRAKPGRNFDPSYLGNDARHQVLLHSILDLYRNWQLDVKGRYLDQLPQTFATIRVPAYFTMDARLAYTLGPVELSIVGQNLWKKQHAEFGPLLIPRSVYVKLVGRF
ncbi:TonB-dependent siderophore receptor [Telluribacter sp. SYSU D00476]|uniref:TonB-dependent receptor plug domain-containing protein n=1 Tax=Telluribacter sp. SYSU D00476 TaxID=2811430 RepID=UPI001FF528F6|nr:TonB-dependent receptor plug domain-containing protein [Telluribacter sp. SYSU D00476]